jgi:hypothetical protein
MRVTHAESRRARQKMLIPVRVGAMNSGIHCHCEWEKEREKVSDGRGRGKDRKGTHEEDSTKDDPEEPETLLLVLDVLVAVEGVEEVDGRDQVRVDDVGREDAECPHQTGDTEAEELGGHEGEDADGVIWGDVVVEFVGGEDGDGFGGGGCGGGHDEDRDVFFDVKDAGVEECPYLDGRGREG